MRETNKTKISDMMLKAFSLAQSFVLKIPQKLIILLFKLYNVKTKIIF